MSRKITKTKMRVRSNSKDQRLLGSKYLPCEGKLDCLQVPRMILKGLVVWDLTPLPTVWSILPGVSDTDLWHTKHILLSFEVSLWYLYTIDF